MGNDIQEVRDERVVFYTMDENTFKLPVFFESETLWTTQKIMAALFGVEINTIIYHLQEIFKNNELDEGATTRKFRVVQKEGSREVKREILFYNLDTIIAVGYRVNSESATRFRQWATEMLHKIIVTGLSRNKSFDDLNET